MCKALIRTVNMSLSPPSRWSLCQFGPVLNEEGILKEIGSVQRSERGAAFQAQIIGKEGTQILKRGEARKNITLEPV